MRLKASVFAIIAATVTARAATESPDFTTVRQLITDRMTAESVPSVALSVVRDGHVVWEEGFNATASTPFALASVTKTLTGLALTTLVERGRIDLDRPVNAYIGRAKVHSTVWDANEATVRRIASHTAGLTTYDRECGPHDRGCSMDDTIRHYAVMVRPPGRDFDYSNLDYGIVGEVIARVSGQRFPMFLRDAIFRPLGMSTCTLPTASSSTTPGASAALCSAHDLALFAQSMSKARIDPLLSRAVSSGPGQRYAMGWWIQDDYYGFQSVYGSGGTTKASATLRLLPSENIGVAVLANKGTSLTDKVADAVLAELVPTIRERQAMPVVANAPARLRPTASGALAGTWKGVIATHEGNRPLVLRVNREGQVSAGLDAATVSPLARGLATATRVFGTFAGDLRVADAPAPPYNLQIGLEQNGERLLGFATTQPLAGKSGSPLSFWVELRKLTAD
jgi:CubicO group peptidase (beta-lactamase class C family)